MVIDPVCGMEVNEKKARFKSSYKGKTYYFCAAACKNTFDKKPEKYAKETEALSQSGSCCCC